jgi:aryl-alcohol dehydrogenase-like predicted oxidoreductase
MDVGCYCASMARLVAGAALGQEVAEPLQVKGCGHLDPVNRVDEWATAALKFEGGIVANLTTGIQVAVDPALRIWGSEGHLVVPVPWFPAQGENTILVYRDGVPEPETVLVPADATAYSLEADTVARHIQQRQAPAPAMTWADSLGNIRTLDLWRREIGLTFDNEKEEALRTPVAGRKLARRQATPPMQYGHVAGVDKPISRIVMGSMVFKQDELPLTCAMLDDFYARGGNCLDTAYVYGTEATVAKWLALRGVREEMVLIGKGAHTPECHPEGLTRQLHETLARLQTDYLDIYMMHRDNPAIPVGEFVECLNEHHRQGRMRAFGGSNWSIERLTEANEYARTHGLVGFGVSSPNLALAAWNEPMWKGCVAASDPASRAWYARAQTPLFAWSSQASGMLTGRFTWEDRTNPALATVARTWFNEANFQRLARAQELARRKGVTSTQIGLAWVLCQPFPVYALIGPRMIEETRTSVEALGVTLTAQELRWLNLEE